MIDHTFNVFKEYYMSKKTLSIGIIIGLIAGYNIASLMKPVIKQTPTINSSNKSNYSFNHTNKPFIQKNAATKQTIEPPIKKKALAKETIKKSAGSNSLNIDTNIDIEQFIKLPLHETIIISQVTNLDGSKYSKEKLHDGLEVVRSYNPKGTAITEHFDLPEGESIDRSFFEFGGTKAVRLTLKNGATASLSIDSSGIATARIDNFPNGDKLLYEYNDQGQISKKWYVQSGKNPVQIY